MAQDSTIADLLRALSNNQRAEVLTEAGVQRRVEIVKGAPLVGLLTAEEVRAVIPPLLRRIHVSDEDFGAIAREAQLSLHPKGLPGPVNVKFPLVSAYSAVGLPITELAATSLILWELSWRVARVLHSLNVQEPLEPPHVQVTSASVNFTFGSGTMLTAGIAFMVAAHEAMAPGLGANVAYFGGSVIGALGFIDLLVNWRKLIVETSKTESETVLNGLKARLTELEITKATRELAPACHPLYLSPFSPLRLGEQESILRWPRK